MATAREIIDEALDRLNWEWEYQQAVTGLIAVALCTEYKTTNDKGDYE